MWAFVIDIAISFMTLIIVLAPRFTVKFSNKKLNNAVGTLCAIGLMVVGVGVYIGGSLILSPYVYIPAIVQLVILGIFSFIYFACIKRNGFTTLLNVISICLVCIALFVYVFYVIGSFIHYS